MVDIATEKQHLAQANRDIAEGELRVDRQAELVQHMRDGALETAEAERLLLTLKQTLATWRNHRDNILATIAQMESGDIADSLPKPLDPVAAVARA